MKKQIEPAPIVFEMKQIFDPFEDKKAKHGVKGSGDFLLNDFYDGNFGIGAVKNSSPFELAPPIGMQPYNNYPGENQGRNEAKKLHTSPVEPEQMKREEIDMEELNALLGLND